MLFERILAPAGQVLLAELAERDLRDATLLSELERLRARYDAPFARAAVELALLRKRAASKFPRADRMYFTREALEQATAAPVAIHRAQRLVAALGPSPHVADLCCGIGGDALAFAAAGARVTALDNDPLRLALAEANAHALGLAERVTFVCADVTAAPPPVADALFCDPARRSAGRRVFDAEQYQPPLSLVLGWRAFVPALGVKLAPGIDYDSLEGIEGCEVEFVSLAGELKEAVLWCGPLASASRRATLLPAGVSLTNDPSLAPLDVRTPGSYLYEPDPAIIRAHLVAEVGHQLGAAQLDATIAYLTADERVATPLARSWPIHEWLPFNLKKLRARLREYDVGPVTVKKRGSPLDTDALARQLSGKGATPLVVVLTLVQGRPAALICGEPAG